MPWVLPTGWNDPDTAWKNETYAFDGDTGTKAATDPVFSEGWSSFLELTIDAIYCSKIKYNPASLTSDVEEIDVDVYYGDAWHDVYQGIFANQQWAEKPLGGTYLVTKVRFSGYNKSALFSHEFHIREAEFYNVVVSLTAAIIIATSITGSLSRGITEVLTSTISIATSVTSTLSRGITESLTSTINGTTSVVGSLSRGIKGVLTSSIDISVSITSTLSRGITVSLSTLSAMISSVTNRFVSISGIHKEVKKPDTTYYEVK